MKRFDIRELLSAIDRVVAEEYNKDPLKVSVKLQNCDDVDPALNSAYYLLQLDRTKFCWYPKKDKSPSIAVDATVKGVAPNCILAIT